MTEPAPPRPRPTPLYVAKGLRVFVSGLLSITLPFYLGSIGYGRAFQGLVLVAILAGNILSNVAVTYLDGRFGRRRLLQAFSALIVASGATLALSASAGAILLACLVGNISSTGTEAGPFQSIEAGTLPDLVPAGKSVKAFGKYNLVGYAAAALGQLASAGPGALGNSQAAFQTVFVVFSAVGMALFAIYSRLGVLDAARSTRPGLANLRPQAKEDIKRLSALFSVDAFGGVFVTTYLLSIWFNSTYGLQLEELGTVFFVASVAAAASTYGAALIALRIGNLRTMVYTHLVSSGLLVLMGLAGSLALALLFLFLRQSFSQMDVPTRQALMAEMFIREERVQAYAVTNTVRSSGSFLGGPVAAAMLGSGLVTAIPFVGGGTKIAYDLLTYSSYRRRYR
ncbi:MAG: MFS transporter [Nitrososphaerota archaeon]|nr:MFS transporter [Nitrososphaerota archaeon]